METIELKETKSKTKKIISKAILKALQDANILDEDGYSVASLEEAIADYRAGRVTKNESWEDRIKRYQREIDNDI